MKGWYHTVDVDLAHEVASERQKVVFDLVRGGMNQPQAASELGINVRNVGENLERLKKKLATRGWHPDSGLVHPVAPGQMVKGVSTLYNDAGGTTMQWVKTSTDGNFAQEQAEAALQGFLDEVPKMQCDEKTPIYTGAPNLCNTYVITDYHLGMQAWGEETRDADWDTGIAEQLLLDWIHNIIMRSPPAETAVFAQLGDFLHWDGLDAVTPQSGHVLDADTRFQKVVRTAIRVLRSCVEIMLEHHKHVHIIMAEGNHDLASSVWLREMFWMYYEHEPRVEVELSPDPYYAFKWGNTGLYFHHGHKRGMRELDRVFASKFREQYGTCQHNYGHSGHYHFDKQETSLMTIEQHRTLAAADAYASRGGWMSGRGAKCITYHKEFGEVGRTIVTPDMLKCE